jgi:hypothetical protein
MRSFEQTITLSILKLKIPMSMPFSLKNSENVYSGQIPELFCSPPARGCLTLSVPYKGK